MIEIILPAMNTISSASAGLEGSQEVFIKSWGYLIRQSGIPGLLLLSCLGVGVAQLIEFLLRFRESRLANRPLLSEVKALLGEGNADRAFLRVQSDPGYTGRVLAGALGRRSGGYGETSKGLEEAKAVESSRLNARISHLSLIALFSLLFGLFGAAAGLVLTFQHIELMQAPTLRNLAPGVYESLSTAVFGFFLAIVFLSAHLFVKRMISRRILQINAEISDLLFQAMSSRPAQGGGG